DRARACRSRRPRDWNRCDATVEEGGLWPIQSCEMGGHRIFAATSGRVIHTAPSHTQRQARHHSPRRATLRYAPPARHSPHHTARMKPMIDVLLAIFVPALVLLAIVVTVGAAIAWLKGRWR